MLPGLFGLVWMEGLVPLGEPPEIGPPLFLGNGGPIQMGRLKTVLRLFREGCTVHEIAAHCGVSESAIRHDRAVLARDCLVDRPTRGPDVPVGGADG